MFSACNLDLYYVVIFFYECVGEGTLVLMLVRNSKACAFAFRRVGAPSSLDVVGHCSTGYILCTLVDSGGKLDSLWM